jgi:hypothetical protein
MLAGGRSRTDRAGGRAGRAVAWVARALGATTTARIPSRRRRLSRAPSSSCGRASRARARTADAVVYVLAGRPPARLRLAPELEQLVLRFLIKGRDAGVERRPQGRGVIGPPSGLAGGAQGQSWLSVRGVRAWDYDYACLLICDNSKERRVEAAWESLAPEVQSACWTGTNIYVMVLRGADSGARA